MSYFILPIRFVRIAALLTVLLSGVSCRLLVPPAPVKPVPTLSYEAKKGPARELIVFLPGRWSEAAEFAEHRMVEIAQEHRPWARAVAPDLHLRYYTSRQLVPRLSEDILSTAKNQKTTLVGVSMGGLGALITALEKPNQIDEIILLSPFVGDEPIIKEIRAAGGLARWNPPADMKPSDFQPLLWAKMKERWLKNPSARPRLSLYCGAADRLLESNRLFAETFLQPHEWLIQPGDHDWPTWAAGLTWSLKRQK